MSFLYLFKCLQKRKIKTKKNKEKQKKLQKLSFLFKIYRSYIFLCKTMNWIHFQELYASFYLQNKK